MDLAHNKISMWQLFQNAVLTHDNMRKKSWSGSPLCSYCDRIKTAKLSLLPMSHLQGGAGKTLCSNLCPKSLWQSVAWFYAFLPGGERFFMVGVMAICCAIWNIRNKVTPDGHKMWTPCEINFF